LTPPVFPNKGGANRAAWGGPTGGL
jgi:hypothetical protein